MQSHVGIKGFVLDDKENPVPGAKVVVQKMNEATGVYELIKHHVVSSINPLLFPFRSKLRLTVRLNYKASTGEYWRLLSPGKYSIWAVSPDFTYSKRVYREVTYEPHKEADLVNLRLKKRTPNLRNSHLAEV